MIFPSWCSKPKSIVVLLLYNLNPIKLRISLFLILYLFLSTSAFNQIPADHLFTDLFENTNVGNLHVFATPNNQEKYAFAGTSILSVHQKFLPLRMRKKVLQGKIKVMQLQHSRNGSNDFCILNISQKGHPAQLVLYRFYKQKLKK